MRKRVEGDEMNEMVGESDGEGQLFKIQGLAGGCVGRRGYRVKRQ